MCVRQVLEYERQQDLQFLAKRRRNYMGSSYLPPHTGSMAGWKQARTRRGSLPLDMLNGPAGTSCCNGCLATVASLSWFHPPFPTRPGLLPHPPRSSWPWALQTTFPSKL